MSCYVELQWGLHMQDIVDKVTVILISIHGGKMHALVHTSTWCGEHHVRCYIHIATRHIECSIDCDCVGAEFFKISE